MTPFLVSDPSEAMELCASQRLYLKPILKLTVSVLLPEGTKSTQVVSELEVIEKLKNAVCPEHFISIELIKKTKSFILFGAEAETDCLIEKLHSNMIKISGFTDDLLVVARESFFDFPTPQELEPKWNTRKFPGEDLAVQAKDSPDCIHLEGLPCKWFAVNGSGSESPSEDVLRAVFEKFGKTKNIDISVLGHYREEVLGETMDKNTLCGLQTFEAFVQYQETTSFSKAIKTFKRMMLMFKGDDGKAIASKIKVTPDTTDHFGESAANQKKLENLALQEIKKEPEEEDRIERKQPNDEEKKTGERTREYKRHEKKQADKPLKQSRKKQVSNAEDLSREKMPTQEEKESSIPQKRVESMRLLSSLLNKVKDVAVASKQIGDPLPDLENKRKVSSLTSQIHNAPKEQVNSHGQQVSKVKSQSRYHLPQLAFPFAKRKEPYIPTAPIGRNSPVAGTSTNYLRGKEASSSHYSLKIPATQKSGLLKSPYQGEDLERIVRYFPRTLRADTFEKEKIYETDEFIYYLLNYYQTPAYERDFPELHVPVSNARWQRVVHLDEKNKDGASTKDLSCIPNTLEKSSRSIDHWGVIDEEPEVLPKSQARVRESVKNLPVWCKDLSDQEKEGMLHGELNIPALLSATHERKSQAEETEMMAVPSHKPVSKLKEVSTESEHFSEVHTESQSKKEIKNGGSHQMFSIRKVKDLLISFENVHRDDRDFEFLKRKFSSDLLERSQEKLGTVLEETSSKAGHEGARISWAPGDEEREAGRKKRRRYDDEPQFFKANHCEELKPHGEMQRKYSRMFQSKYVTHMDGCPFKEAQEKADKGNVDIHKTSENGCKADERQRACKDSTGRGVLRQARDV